MKFLTNCLKGVAIGSGAILPGISSGVFCVIFGIYEKLLDSILNFFSDVKNNFKFLFPILIGVGFGVVLFGNPLNYCLYQFPVQTKSIFIGLIFCSIPALLKETHKRQKAKTCYWFFFFFALLIGIASLFLEKYLPIHTTLENVSFFYLALCGFFMSVGIVVPGVSSTIILMLLGVYPIYLSSISSVYLPILIPIGIGVMLGGFLFMKLTKFLLEHFYAPTFYAIIGFTVGSIFVLLPSFSSFLEILIGVLCCFLRFCCCLFFWEKKYIKKNKGNVLKTSPYVLCLAVYWFFYIPFIFSYLIICFSTSSFPVAINVLYRFIFRIIW